MENVQVTVLKYPINLSQNVLDVYSISNTGLTSEKHPGNIMHERSINIPRTNTKVPRMFWKQNFASSVPTL